MSSTPFDITTFKVILPAPLDASCQVDMNGLRFYAEQPWNQSASSSSVGSPTAPAYVLIGLVGPTFTPMLLAYGVVTLSNTNGGINFYNYVSWTLGIYTIANKLAVSTTPSVPAQVTGGMMILPFDGGVYTDSLLNAGTTFPIKTFANGAVTTTTPNSFTSGQNLQFGSLANPSGGIENGTGYRVDTVLSVTQFTIAALDYSDVTKAAADSGMVTTIPSPSDSQNWGALVPNGQQMQLTTTDQRTYHTFYAGFTPSRMLYTKTTDAVPQPVLQFSGVQTVEYKGGSITAGMGFQSANTAKYLQINYQGYYQFIDANNGGDNEVVLTFAVGSTPAAEPITTSGIVKGTLSIQTQNPGNPLTVGDWVHFIGLTILPPAGGSAPALTIGPPYKIASVSGSTFQLIDPSTGAAGFANVDASAATLIKETLITTINQPGGKAGLKTVVSTLDSHKLSIGDGIIFIDLELQSGYFDETQTYYVTDIYDDTSFSFAEVRGGTYNPTYPITASLGGRVTFPLGKIAGFDVGGDVTVTATCNGGYQLGGWAQPTEFSFAISGSLSMSYLQENSVIASGSLSLKGNSETSVGLLIQWEDGTLSVPAWAFTLSASMTIVDNLTKKPKIAISLSGVSVAATRADDGTETYAINASVSAAIESLAWSGAANFGHGQTNGLTLVVNNDGSRYVQQCSASIVTDHVSPPSPPSPPNTKLPLSHNFSIMQLNVNVDYNRSVGSSTTNDGNWSLLVGGAITIAIGDSTPDANGNWQSSVDKVTFSASPDAVELSDSGFRFLPGRYELDLNGPFSVDGKIVVVTQSLKLVYQSADVVTGTDEQILFSGAVVLPQLRNARVQFGNNGASGGLEIDLSTNKWKLDGWRITIPSFSAVSLFQLQNFVLGFSKTTDADGNDDYEIQAGGQIQLLKGKGAGLNIGVDVKLDIDNGKLSIVDIGASLRNMNPGIVIPPVDGFLTDIAFDVDGIPGSISADILFGAVFGDKVTVGAKEYSTMQAIVNGQYKYRDISLSGTVLIAGGTLGEITGTLDFNWGIDVYSVNLSGKLFYDVIESNLILYFSETLDYGLFSTKLQVPPNIPIIGGISLLEADAMYYVDHTPGGHKFIAAWFEFLGHWKYGVEFQFAGGGWSLLGTNAVDGLQTLLPSGTGSKPNKYNIGYSPTMPSLEAAQSRELESDESSDSYGLLNITWDQPDNADDTIFIAVGSNDAVQVYGPGTALDSYGWVNDSDGAVSYMVLADQSSAGNVLIHVSPTASFTATGASHDNPELYTPLPSASFNVVLTSNVAQSGDPTVNWTGSFAAAPPELQNVTVTQPSTVSALGGDLSDDVNPDPVTADNATITFQWRGLDPNSTVVSLYYDYNSSGYLGINITAISGSDLTIGTPDGNGWRTVTVPWDIGSLEPLKSMYAYAVIKDDGHAAGKSDYAGNVQTVPAAQIQVSYSGGTTVSATELEDILLAVTPVKEAIVNSIAAGVVTVTDSTDITVGDMFMFSGLTSPIGVQNTTPYYVIGVNGETFTFSNVAAGAPMDEVSAEEGTVYVDEDVPTIYGTNTSGTVWPQVNVNQTYRFSMSPPRGIFIAAPSLDQEVSNVGDLVQYNTFVGENQLLRMNYQFSILAAIAGRIYSDLSNNGELNSMDTGLAGVTVYLDDDNNNVLDLGEDSVVTGPDGNYLFVHKWAATDTPTTTYTTWVKVIPPTGWQLSLSPSLPASGITFTNDGTQQAALEYYNFLIASPITIGGIVFEDANANGVRDPGEKGLSGVTVNVTPPGGSAIVAITDETGAWQATAHTRGTYSVSIDLPVGGTFTTATSTSLTADSATALVLQNSKSGEAYLQTGVASQWDPTTKNYSTWLAALWAQNVSQYIDFADVQSNPTGNVNVVNTVFSEIEPNRPVTSRFDAFIGKWTSGGTPSLAVAYPWMAGTNLAITPSNHVVPPNKMPLLMPASMGVNELFALSYDPSQPGYSTVASIDATGQVTTWKFSPANVGNGLHFPFFNASQTFKLTQGTPVKMLGFNKAGSDHFQSQDLAVVYRNVNGVLALAELNHTTNAVTTYPIGGRVLVDMISGDFNGNGLEDLAVITADTHSQQYYLNILISQDDGSTNLVPHVGNDLALAADGTPGTTLASIRVKNEEQALLWGTQSSDGSAKYITAALVSGGQLRLSRVAVPLTGRIAAISAGGIGTPAAFAIYSFDMSVPCGVPATTGTVQVNTDGMIAVTEDLTQYGGSFIGFDVGVTGIKPSASNVTSGIVYNDVNSNGIQDPGETGLPGITVRLIQPNNATQTTVTSDGGDGRLTGSYSFENVPSGAYIQVTLPPGTWTAQNPPPGISTNVNGSDGIVVGVTFAAGQPIDLIDFTDGSDNAYSIVIKAADLQANGQENLVIRASSALFVQRFQSDGTSTFDRYSVSSPAAYFRPELFLEDLNTDGRIDIVTSGQSGVDVFINIGFGEFRPFTGLLAELLSNTPNGAYSAERGFTSDLESGVTSAKTYTHALNFGGADIVVNGVTLTAASPSGSNYSLEATDPRNGAADNLILNTGFVALLSGSFLTIAQTCYHSPANINGTEQLILKGLTPGLTYMTTFYTVGNNAAPHCIQTVVDSLGGTLMFDANGGENLNGYMVLRTFTAITDTIIFTFFAQDPSQSFNLIAMTNEAMGVGYNVPATFTDDDNSGISGGAVYYTHILNFGATAPVTVNALTFTPAGQSGPNWLLTGYDPESKATPAMSTYTDFVNSLIGNVNALASNFFYSQVTGELLTLSGLAIGATYTTTWYGVGFEAGMQRAVYITDTLGGSAVVDENLFGSGNGIIFSRTFTATNDSITFTFVASVPGAGFHQYAVTNQLVPSGDYACSNLSADAGSGIGATKTYTHAVNWEGAAPLTVNGLTFQGDGRTGTNYSIVNIDPHSLSESEIEYFLNFVNNVTGELNAIISTGYIGAAKVILNGLVPGTTYLTTFYAAGDGLPGGRLQTISDSQGGTFHFDENMFGSASGFLLTRTYVAATEVMTFYVIGDDLQNPFLQGALTNEVVPGSQKSPFVYGTELAVIPATVTSPAKIYAAQQNTQAVYELAWDTGTATLTSTGRFFVIDRLVTRMVAGSVMLDGEFDLVVYENSNNGPAGPLPFPDNASYQKLWGYTPADLYAAGTKLIDLGFNTYQAEIDLLLAPLFPGVQTVCFMGIRNDSPATDLVTYRAGITNTTPLSNVEGYSLGVGQFVPGSRAPNILVAGINSITVLESGINPEDANDPDGADPSVALILLGTTYTPHSWNATAVGASVTTHSDDIIAVVYDYGTGFAVLPYFNITGGYEISANAGGGLFDFPVVVPGSNGGTINGNVFYDADGSGTWEPADHGVAEDIMVYLDLNNNGQWDPTEPRRFPNRDGDFQFTQLLPQAYTVGIQVGSGYVLTTPSTLDATVPSVPGGQVNGIDFGVRTKDFSADLRGNHQPDLGLGEPKQLSSALLQSCRVPAKMG